MKIIFVNRYFYPDFSATSQILYDLAKALARHGFEIEIICSRFSYQNREIIYPRHEVIDGVTVHRVRTSNFGRAGFLGRAVDYLSFYFSSAVQLARRLKEKDIVVAKTDPPLLSVICGVVAKYKKATLINWMQDVFPEVYSNLGYYCPKWILWGLKAARNWSMRIADANVVLGHIMKDQFIEQGIGENSLYVIENWANEGARPPVKMQESQLYKELLLQGKFIVAYSGNLGRAHDYQTLLHAAQLLSIEKDILFLVIGGGIGYEKLKENSEKNKIENFLFLPYQKRECLADVLAAANVHLVSLLPELEGLIVPSKFYGILAAGRPTIMIGSVNGELARIIESSELGGVAEVGNAEELVRHIKNLKNNPSIAEAMGERAYNRYQSSYTLERAVNKWINMIGKLVKA